MRAAESRPLGVIVLSAAQLFVAGYMLVVSYQMAHGKVLGVTSREALGALADRAPYLAILAILPAALSIGLYLMANWARTLALVFYSFLLLGCIFNWVGIVALSTSSAKVPRWILNYLILRTALYGWAVLYLFRPRVERAFREAY